MRLAAALFALHGPDPAVLRAGLDTLYTGHFDGAARYFAAQAAAFPRAAAPLVFEAGAYIWWAAALAQDGYARERIDSLLGLAIARARVAADEFWLATAYGYRARQRELHGDGLGAAKDAKRMRDGYRRVLAARPDCADCYLGIGLYDYGLARASAVARLVARLIGLGGGNAARGVRHIRRAARDGDLARVEATWVLAAALVREADRARSTGAALRDEAVRLVRGLADRYPENPVFSRFLRELAASPHAYPRPATAQAPRFSPRVALAS